MKPRLKVYFGKVCAKHPELKGERRLDCGRCVECQRLATRACREKNREQELARRRARYHKNKAAETAYWREWFAKNKEAELARGRLRYKKNKAAMLFRSRQWYAAFKEKHGISYRTHLDRIKKERELKCAV